MRSKKRTRSNLKVPFSLAPILALTIPLMTQVYHDQVELAKPLFGFHATVPGFDPEPRALPLGCAISNTKGPASTFALDSLTGLEMINIQGKNRADVVTYRGRR